MNNWRPPTGRATHAKLWGGPCGGEIVPLLGTRVDPPPILKKDGKYWYHRGHYEWRTTPAGEVQGDWTTF